MLQTSSSQRARTGSWDTTPMWERSHLTCSRRTSVLSSSTCPPCTSYSRCASATCHRTTAVFIAACGGWGLARCAHNSDNKAVLRSTVGHLGMGASTTHRSRAASRGRSLIADKGAHHGGLAAAAGADQRKGAAGGDTQVEGPEYRHRARRVCKGDVAQLQVAHQILRLVTCRKRMQTNSNSSFTADSYH
jgi:hypothetical protein